VTQVGGAASARAREEARSRAGRREVKGTMAKTGKKQETEPAADAPGFEASIERLEAIVAEMESGRLPLETMIARFEEGQRLIASCAGTLNDVERRIEILVRKDDGRTEAEPFDTPADGEPAPADQPDDGDELF
jgi:exodeoxyribonuclease VII small subunit